MYKHPLPKRVRVLVLGGGIHGVGVLHDMVSRGWSDVHLLEKNTLASGTSSKSTKLIHGGLRYLRRPSQAFMVAESLRERRFLLDVAPDIVKPLELVFPILKKGGERAWLVRCGLSLYDLLAGRQGIEGYKSLTPMQAASKVPNLRVDDFCRYFSFWDGQTDDLALVQRVADSATFLGAGISEGTRATSIRPYEDGWLVDAVGPDGQVHTISALYVVNCLGPWANRFLQANSLRPPYKGLNDKGIHLVLPDLGLKAGLFMQSPKDKRIAFLLPWLGKTLLGTTEDSYEGDLDHIDVQDAEISYLIEMANKYLTRPVSTNDIETSFAGLRWLAVESRRDISQTSREVVIGENAGQRGQLLTIYGGKLTSYRSLAAKIGDKICLHFGEFTPSATKDRKNWLVPGPLDRILEVNLKDRFAKMA